ncbi:MAG: hypothetical protein ACYC7E_22810 [Armatimonadota bacterium]
MRCQSQLGFLMLHRCEGVAAYKCVQCGRNVCPQHAVFPDQAPQAAAAGTGQPGMTAPPPGGVDVTSMPAPPPPSSMPTPPPGANVDAVICPECARKSRQQQRPNDQGAYTRDDYYGYPYYGGYHPYYWGHDYNDHDRHVFDRDQDQAGVSDAQES